MAGRISAGQVRRTAADTMPAHMAGMARIGRLLASRLPVDHNPFFFGKSRVGHRLQAADDGIRYIRSVGLPDRPEQPLRIRRTPEEMIGVRLVALVIRDHNRTSRAEISQILKSKGFRPSILIKTLSNG